MTTFEGMAVTVSQAAEALQAVDLRIRGVPMIGGKVVGLIWRRLLATMVSVTSTRFEPSLPTFGTFYKCHGFPFQFLFCVSSGTCNCVVCHDV